MADDNEREASLARLAHQLSEDTGITVTQAEDLIKLLGTGWPTLLREARALKWEENRLRRPE